jgi:hypothetical protein
MNKNIKNVTTNFRNDINYEVNKMMSLLRRVYDVVEMRHLNDSKLIPHYTGDMPFPRKLGDDIFNYLSSKDQEFRNVFIRRQKRYRNYQKAIAKRKSKILMRKEQWINTLLSVKCKCGKEAVTIKQDGNKVTFLCSDCPE